MKMVTVLNYTIMVLELASVWAWLKCYECEYSTEKNSFYEMPNKTNLS